MTAELYDQPIFRVAGDQGLMMEFGEGISPLIHQRIQAMLFVLEKNEVVGIVEYSPAYRSITFVYNCLQSSHRQLQGKLTDIYQKVIDCQLPAPQIVELPVCYGADFGPDLAYVAKVHDLSAEQVITMHSQPEYLVYMLGFSPGFPFLGGPAYPPAGITKKKSTCRVSRYRQRPDRSIPRRQSWRLAIDWTNSFAAL
jgi:inhibitor of KinA